jgi:glycosyltransferase involved in cell wall biosynthesis
VFELYGEADCLLFPSRLETWGLPITEFRATGKPMLVADMPYANETAGDYELVKLFDSDDAVALADLMVQAAKGEPIFGKLPEARIAPPFARNWTELWGLLLAERRGG